MKTSSLSVIFVSIIAFTGLSQSTIATVAFHPDLVLTASNYQSAELTSHSFSGLSKLQSVFGTSPYYTLSNTEFWPVGSWGRGYFSEITPLQYYDGTRACKPLVRRTSDFVIGHLNLASLGYTIGNSIQKAKDGIDYLISQQYPSGHQYAGGFVFWLDRESQTNLNMNISSNTVNEYETAYALAALSEYYQSGINYRRQDVLNSIQLAESNLINWDYINSNNNLRGLVLWGLSEAYKVTRNCNNYKKIKLISIRVIQEQNNSTTDLNGEWLTGSVYPGTTWYHDTQIDYHFMTLRGLVSVMSIVPDLEFSFKTEVTNCVKRAVNHVINYRLGTGSKLRYVWRDVNGNIVNQGYVNPIDIQYDYQNYLEPIARLYYLSNTSSLFNSNEQTNLRYLLNKLAGDLDQIKWWHFKALAIYANYMDAVNNSRLIYDWKSSDLNYTANQINGRIVSGDFDNDGKLDDIVGFYDYGNDQTKLHLWKSNGTSFTYSWPWSTSGYNANQITDRIVSGDFDNDGIKDDIVAFYDYGSEQVKMHLWKFNGSSVSYSWPWSTTGYTAAKIDGRVVSGDFDNDGYHDDIAAFYNYGNEQVKIHLWKFNGSSVSYSWSWATSGYTADMISGRVVSGDFDNDGYHDDIAAFYDYGNDNCKIHLWKSSGSNFSYSWSWQASGYNANKITNRVVSGDFDSDGYADDIAALYDYGNEETKLHYWSSNGSSLPTVGHGARKDITPNMISKRVVAGDFDQNCKNNDIGAFYDYNSEKTAIHVWKSSNYQGPNSWWLPCPSSPYSNCTSRTMIQNIDFNSPNIEDNSPIIFPNPFESSFKLHFNTDENRQINVYSTTGDLVFSTYSDTQQLDIELSNVARGFTVLINTDDNSIRAKVIKE